MEFSKLLLKSILAGVPRELQTQRGMLKNQSDRSRDYGKEKQRLCLSSLVLITVVFLSGLPFKVLAEQLCNAESPFELVVSKAAETNAAYNISPEQQKILNDGVWSRITSRSTGRIYRLFAQNSNVMTVGGSEISLSNIHAVDVAYPQHDDHGTITDKRVADTDDSAGLDKYDANMVPLIKKYPRNYHSQLFQNLDLHDENGKRMLFTKIISSYALGYVLEIKEIPEKVRFEMFDRVIDHLAPSGKLIIFPMTLSKEDPFGAAFYSRLAELKKNKIISDYSVHEKNGALSWVLVK